MVQITFILILPNEKQIFLPLNTTTNRDVYEYISKFDNNDLILYYKDIPIPRNKKINLIDIGYDPYEKLYMKHVETQDCTFLISKYNYSTTKKIFSYQTFFNIKIFFARQFNTVAHNIIIKNESKIFNDEELILKNGRFFEIDAINDFSIYYVIFLTIFMFICLSNDSTFEDLKISLSGYYNIPFNSIKMGPSLSEALKVVPNPNKVKIQDHLPKLNILDFEYEPNSSATNQILDICIESNNDGIVYEYKEFYPGSPLKKQPRAVLESIKCFLEKKTHIERNNLICYNDTKHSGKCAYYSLKKLYVTVDKMHETYPYLVTVKELREKYCDIDHNLGFVINGRLALKDSDFLVKYLGSPINDEKNRLHIHILRPNNGCRLCKIQYGNKFKTKSLIIPSNYTFNDIATTYFGMKPNSMQFFSGLYSRDIISNPPNNNTDKLMQFKFTEFHAILTKELVIKYHFADEAKEYTISMNNANNPQIKDFIYEIYKQNEDKFVYDVFIRDKRINFWEYLFEYSDQTLTIKKYPTSENDIYIYDATNNDYINLHLENNAIDVSSIIKCFYSENASKYSLYMDFHKLSPEDKPALLYQPYNFLILNENKEEREFTVTNNKDILLKEKVILYQNPLISAIIINKFGLINSNVSFSLELDPNCKINQKSFSLPSSFDAGSIPDKSIISIDYKTLETNNYTFYYEKSPNEVIKEKITLSDPIKSIRILKKEIINKLRIFNLSPKAVDFYFLDNKLNQNKSFSSYGISENSIITISHQIHAIKVDLRLFDDTNLGYHFFNDKTGQKDSIKDVIEILKLEYGINDPDYELKIYSKPDKDSLLDVNRPLEDNEVLYASFEKVKIRLLDPIKGERIEVDEIIKPTNKYLSKKIYPLDLLKDNEIKKENLIFYRQDGFQHYVAIDPSKTFKDFGDRQFFVLEQIGDITLYFNGRPITLHKDLQISKYESVGSIKTNYLSKQILASPNSFKLTVNNIEVNEKDTIGNLIMNGKKIEIIFIKNINDDINYDRKSKKLKSKIRFIPFVTPISNNKISKSKSSSNEDQESTNNPLSSIEKQEKSLDLSEKSENAKDKVIKGADTQLEEKVDQIKVEYDNKSKELFETKIVPKEDSNDHIIDSKDESHYRVLSKIGEGSTSNVYKVIDETTGREICKKVIKEASDEKAMSVLRNTLKEINFFSIAKHPCICKLLGYNLQEELPKDEDDDDDDDDENIEKEGPKTTIAIYFEYLPFSIKQLRDCKLLCNTLKVRISIEIAFGMSYIHSLGMIHRDLKIENIMLNGVFNAKIIDFGLVRLNDDLNKNSTLTRGIGTLAYMSPEMIAEKEYDNKTDVYSYGILLYALFIGHLPKQSVSDRLANVELDFPKPSKKINEYCIDLIKRCTSFESSNRPSFDEIVDDFEKHSFTLAPGIDTEVINERYKTLNMIRLKEKKAKK